MQFDLVCDRSYYSSLTQSFYMVGYMFAGVFLSYFSDKNGRKPVAVVSIAVELVATLSCALSVNFWQYLASRFLLGFGTTGRSMSLRILCKKKRRRERI